MTEEKIVLKEEELDGVSGGRTYILERGVSEITGHQIIKISWKEYVKTENGWDIREGHRAIRLEKFDSWKQKHSKDTLLGTDRNPFTL